MTEEESWLLVGDLAVETSGWDDINIEATRKRIEGWPDFNCGREAVETVIETHDGYGRPLWGALNNAYRSSARRRTMAAPALLSGAEGRILSFAEGRVVAAKSYSQYCVKRDTKTDPHILSGFRSTEPNPKILDQLLGFVKSPEE
ncbi:hypothetical protein [Ilumatobacter sp.]|uniref:hypothetical protein n=1 Tax=Ilumatobacter sp. TaxID=1967498 RepID=UPI0037515815